MDWTTGHQRPSFPPSFSLLPPPHISKPAWAIAVAVLCFLLFDGYGGYIKDLLETPLFTIINRLCYSAYLVHPMVLYWHYAEQSRAVRFDGCW